MAVLTEAISVVVRRDAIDRAFRGGWQAFLNAVPNRTVCEDGALVRVGFMHPGDAEAYTSTLEAGGMVSTRDGQAVDFVIVQQLAGPAISAPWLNFDKVDSGSMTLAACWLRGQPLTDVAVPAGWKFEGSMSQNHTVMDDSLRARLKFLRRENDSDVYLDSQTGTEYFVGRPTIDGDAESAISTRLESLFHEALQIQQQIETTRAGQDQPALSLLMSHLDEKLLPVARDLAMGAGQEMSSAHFVLGLILRVLQRYNEAHLEFRTANELGPGSINTLRELVLCLGTLGRHAEALPFAREAVRLAPLDAGAWGNLAATLAQIGERAEAREVMKKALQLDPDDPINQYVRDRLNL